MESLQEIELISLAEDIGPGKYSRLCNALGYTYAVSQSHIVKHLNNVNEALVELLIKWNNNQRDSSQTRFILASKLHELRIGELGDRILEGKYLPNQQDSHDYKKTPVQTSPGMVAHGGISDNLLFKLAEDIETDEQMEALGRSLRFKAAAINRYTCTNNRGNRVTCKGTRDMLFDWRQTVKPCDQHLLLEQALIDAKLVMLADTHLKEPSSIQDIYSKKISESLTVQQCRDKLENMYRNQLCKIQMTPWNQSDYAEFEDMHTVVTMVKKDGRGRDTKKKEILKGSVSEIFSTKVNGKLPARILISAPAGRGKTTAVAKMAYDWVHKENGSALEHLPLLFVVKFRNTTQVTTIGEAIKSQLLSDVDDLTPKGLERFIKENQGICHIILDGLDEYAGISSSQSSSLSNIVSVIRWKEFPECRVLVTTRPHLENFFDRDDLPRVYTKMWIEGFSRESSCEYINKFFASTTDPCQGQSLKDYLDEQPLIDELVKTPLFCLMVCHLWSEGLLDSCTTTQTELLDRVNVFLMHYANERSRVKITPKKLKEIISQLGEVALSGLLDDAKKLVFTPLDFCKVPAALDRACELGIVSKTTVNITCLPQSIETTSTTVEFYHKLAQEHSAGKFLADKTHRLMLRLKISKLDKVLRKIKSNIGDYENLIRFAAGSDNSLCIRIMEGLLANRRLNESERYRIILDCSSETKGTEGNVSSLVQRCVNAQSIVLKAPTLYTVVGMQNLPKQLKQKVRSVKFEGSTLTTDVTSGLWSCLEAFPMVHTLTISDSSLSFPPSPPVLPSITKLSAERVTSQSYGSLLSSLPGVRDIDVSIDVAETSDNFQTNAASRQMSQISAREEQLFVHIRLHASTALTIDRRIEAGIETIGALSLLIEDQSEDQQRLHVSGVKGSDEESLVDLFVKTKQLTYLNSRRGVGSLNKQNSVQNTRLKIEHCHLSTEMTEKLWASLRFCTLLNQVSISNSTLSFHPSLHVLPSVTKLSTERVSSQSYEGLLPSLPGLKEVDITIGDANTEDISQIQTSLRRHLKGQDLTCINPHSFTSEGNVSIVSRNRMRGLGLLITECQAILTGVVFGSKETAIDLVQSSTRLMSASLYVEQFSRSPNSDEDALQIEMWTIKDCQLSTEMTVKLWSCLRSFTSLNQLTLSDSSLSFPSTPQELSSVTTLSAERMASQSYEGLLSSLLGLRMIDITINDAERDISHITAGLRWTGGHQLTCINLKAPYSLPSKKKNVSSETMRGLGLLIREETKNLHRLDLHRVRSTGEEDLVYLIECCRLVKSMSDVMLESCRTTEGGLLEFHLKDLQTSPGDLSVLVYDDDKLQDKKSYCISHIG